MAFITLESERIMLYIGICPMKIHFNDFGLKLSMTLLWPAALALQASTLATRLMGPAVLVQNHDKS